MKKMSEAVQDQDAEDRAEGGDGLASDAIVPPASEIVAEEEQKLKKKFPTAVRPGGSLFLQKKLLQRDKKYFDSGDYNMARGQAAKGPQPKLKGKTITGERLVVPDEPTGDSHPSPEVIPGRKPSIVATSKLCQPPAAQPQGSDHSLANLSLSNPLPASSLN